MMLISANIVGGIVETVTEYDDYFLTEDLWYNIKKEGYSYEYHQDDYYSKREIIIDTNFNFTTQQPNEILYYVERYYKELRIKLKNLLDNGIL